VNKIKMNKIILEDSVYNKEIKLDNEKDYIIKSNEENKVIFNILDNSNNNIVEINSDNKSQDYTFNIGCNSNINIDIFDEAKNINRIITINLNGEKTCVNLNISSICTNNNKYIVNVFHNKNKTESKAKIHGITLGNAKMNVINNGYIKNGSSKSILNQDNKIIIMDDNNSKIEPNLFIDEYDVEASHGAYIGKFDEEEVFYLKSRGLDEKTSYNLLINGFLTEDFYKYESLINEIKEKINKYWR
jgi:hypothetical protein